MTSSFLQLFAAEQAGRLAPLRQPVGSPDCRLLVAGMSARRSHIDHPGRRRSRLPARLPHAPARGQVPGPAPGASSPQDQVGSGTGAPNRQVRPDHLDASPASPEVLAGPWMDCWEEGSRHAPRRNAINRLAYADSPAHHLGDQRNAVGRAARGGDDLLPGGAWFTPATTTVATVSARAGRPAGEPGAHCSVLSFRSSSGGTLGVRRRGVSTPSFSGQPGRRGPDRPPMSMISGWPGTAIGMP